MTSSIKEIDTRDQEKEVAARAAVELVESGQIVGLGSGSTAAFAVRFLAERVQAGLKIVGIPTSRKTTQLAEQLRIPLTTLEEHSRIDIAVDGADEIDPQLNLIKGGGGLPTRTNCCVHLPTIHRDCRFRQTSRPTW